MRTKMEFETEDCEHCPCLRSFGNEEYGCFFDKEKKINSWDLDEIDKECPIATSVVRN